LGDGKKNKTFTDPRLFFFEGTVASLVWNDNKRSTSWTKKVYLIVLQNTTIAQKYWAGSLSILCDHPPWGNPVTYYDLWFFDSYSFPLKYLHQFWFFYVLSWKPVWHRQTGTTCIITVLHYFTACSIRQAGLSFEAMFEEVPILIRNSHLVNALLCEIEEETPSEAKYNFLDLSTR